MILAKPPQVINVAYYKQTRSARTQAAKETPVLPQ